MVIDLNVGRVCPCVNFLLHKDTLKILAGLMHLFEELYIVHYN